MSNYCIECLEGCSSHQSCAASGHWCKSITMARVELMKAVEQCSAVAVERRIAAKHFRGARGFVPSMFNPPTPVKTHSILAVSSPARPTAIHRCFPPPSHATSISLSKFNPPPVKTHSILVVSSPAGPTIALLGHPKLGSSIRGELPNLPNFSPICIADQLLGCCIGICTIQ